MITHVTPEEQFIANFKDACKELKIWRNKIKSGDWDRNSIPDWSEQADELRREEIPDSEIQYI